jgi:hypothetical protein
MRYKWLRHFRSGHWRPIWLSLLFIGVLAFSGCTRKPPEWSEVLKYPPSPTPEVSPTTPPPTTNELVVYLDTSASMAGYVTKDGQSIFGKTLRELRFATGTFGPDVKVSVRRIASDVGPALTDMELTSASQDQNVYRGGETNLARAISSFKLAAMSNKTDKQAATIKAAETDTPTVEPVPKFHILVTDGVQSTRQGSATHDCTAGSDQFCVRQKIGELLAQHWGGCVLGVRADFHGKVYSEVNHSAIPYDTRTSDPTTFRPFYLYIFSPDPRALESLVNSLKDRLRPLMPKSELIRELNLSFPYANDSMEFEVAIPKDSRAFLKQTKDRSASPPRMTVQVDVDTEKSGAKPFSITAKLQWSNHALDTADEAELAQLLHWEVVQIYPGETSRARKRFPKVKIVGTHVDQPGQITIDATAGFPSGTEAPSWCVYELQGTLNLNEASPTWIKGWSVDLDTTREAGNRTFNLETALLGLWNTSQAKTQVVARAHLRIGPQ